MQLDAASVRTLLRQSHSPIIRVEAFDRPMSGESHEQLQTEALLALPGAPVTRIASADDLSRWAVLEITQRLKHAQLHSPAGGNAVQQLLTGVLADNFLSSQVEFDITPSLVTFIERQGDRLRSFLGADVVEALTGDLMSGDSRSALLRLSPLATSYDGRDLAEIARIKLSRRTPRINPAWSRRFQRPDRPIQFWFDHTPGGTTLFVVHYTAKCTYLQCPWCSLPQLSANAAVRTLDLFSQADFVFGQALDASEQREVRSVLISNNGSVFDERTFSPTALHYTVQRACQYLPKVELLAFETRAEFVTEAVLGPLRRNIDEIGRPIEFEVAIGVEAFDDVIRNRRLKKGLSLRALERVASILREFRGSLRCYFMLKPVLGMSDEEAILDIEQGLDFLDSLNERFGIPVVMHLNPTYAAVGSDLAAALERGEFSPVRLDGLVEFLKRQGQRRTRMHIGLNDEGLAVEGGSFIRPEADEAIKLLRRYNRTNKIDML